MKTKRIFIFLLAGVLVGSLISGCGVLGVTGAAQVEGTVVPTETPKTGMIAEGRIVPQDFAYLSFPTGGKVAEVLVKEGQQVSKDDVLARLDDREPLEAAVTAANLELLQAQQALDDLNNQADVMGRQAEEKLVAANKAVIDAKKALDDLDTDDFQQRLDDANIRVQDRKDDLNDAQDEVDKYKNLDPDNQTRKNAENRLETAQRDYDNAVHDRDILQNQLDDAKAVLAMAESNLADAQREADDHKDGPAPDDSALAQSRLDNAKAQLAAAQKALDHLDLKAPYDGTIIDLELTANEQIPAGQVVVTFADESAWFVETKDLTEMDVVKVSEGQKVTVTPDALPDVTLNGVVDSINNAYRERSGDVLYTVRIRLNDFDPRMRWGMTVSVDFGD